VASFSLHSLLTLVMLIHGPRGITDSVRLQSPADHRYAPTIG
jgi:hypothetical protein